MDFVASEHLLGTSWTGERFDTLTESETDLHDGVAN